MQTRWKEPRHSRSAATASYRLLVTASCSAPLIYSTDSGRTFHGMVYMKSFDPFRDSKDYTVAVDRRQRST